MIRKTFLLSCILCALSVISFVNATSAYFTDHTSLTNRTKIGQNLSILKETFPTPEPIHKDQVQTYQKVVSVSNLYSVPCYARVYVAYSNGTIGSRTSYVNLNTTDWIYIDSSENASMEGYYYYKHPLKPGEATNPLFEGLTIGDHLDFSNNGGSDTFEVYLYEETVQCEPYDNYYDAWNAFIRE